MYCQHLEFVRVFINSEVVTLSKHFMINLIFPTSIDSGEHDEINDLRILKSTENLQRCNLLFSTYSLEKIEPLITLKMM